MTPEQLFEHHYIGMHKVAREQGWGDPTSYARSREIFAAIKLGHTVSITYSGADAYNAQGQPVEYKSTVGQQCQGSYTGISVKPTWEEQEVYLREVKIGKYPEHYYNRFDDEGLAESWVMDGQIVLDTLLPKLKNQFYSPKKKADPRLGASITNTEIRKYGKQVFSRDS